MQPDKLGILLRPRSETITEAGRHSVAIEHIARMAGSHAVDKLEQCMGSPYAEADPFSDRILIELDEADAFPQEQCRRLNGWGLQKYYVPASLGGSLQSYQVTFSLIRSVAARDMTVAIAHAKTYLGSMGVWLGGSLQQKRRMAEIVLSGAPVSLALTEKEHGSDLLRGDVTIVEAGHEGKYRLNGEKWLINNATRSQTLTVFAKSRPAGGARGYALLIVDKHELAPGTYAAVPKIKTLGVRGADISGVVFKDALIPRDAIVGGEQAGLEILLKSLQISRTMCASLSMGVLDTSLRIAYEFASTRMLYDKPVLEIAHARSIVARVYLQLIICDCVSTATARALHFLTGQMGVLSAIAKYFVPTTTDTQIHELSVVLGARHYLRTDYKSGLFQKMLRDSRLVALFDGSGPVNLHALVQQLPLIAKKYLYRSATGSSREERLAKIHPLFDLTCEVPEFDPEALTLSAYGRDDILAAVPDLVAELGMHADADESETMQLLCREMTELASLLMALLSDALSKERRDGRDAFDAAQKFCRIYASLTVAWLWYFNRTQLGEHFANPSWVVYALAVGADRLDKIDSDAVDAATEHAIEWMSALVQKNQSFSIIPLNTLV